MRLRWTTPAANDLYDIVQYIQQDDPGVAAEVAKTLYDGCGSLRNSPNRGRKGRIEGCRELVFPGLPSSLFIGLKMRWSNSSGFIMERRTGPEALQQNHSDPPNLLHSF